MQNYQTLNPDDLGNVPSTLTNGQRFVCWREEIRDDRPTKVPVNATTGNEAKTDDPKTWATLDVAVRAYNQHRDELHGVGRIFDASDGIIGIDFDDCLSVDGSIIPDSPAANWLPLLDSYTEVSPSGRGVKVWLRANHDLGGKSGRRDAKRGVELYRSHRYFTITGRRLSQFSAEVEDRQEVVNDFYAEYFGDKPSISRAPATPPPPTTLSDQQIVERASRAKNGDVFRALWDGNWQTCYGSQSEADAALCSHLWFWSGDRETVRRLFGQSGLARPKWTERDDYRQTTLDLVCRGEVFTPKPTIASGDNTLDIKSLEDLRAAIVGILSRNGQATQKHEDIASRVVGYLRGHGQFYFHSERRDFATAMYFDAETKRLHRVQSDELLSNIAEQTCINRGNPAFKYIALGIETAALHGEPIIPQRYWASQERAIYISNGDGRLAKITASGVAIADNGTDGVLFQSGYTLPRWELVEPEDPFQYCKVFRDANFADDNSRMIFREWAMSLPTHPVCKPPFSTTGPIRSGKTRIIRGICELYGLVFASKEPTRTEKSQNDFWTNIDQGGLLCLDNCDSRIDWLADAVSTASTGSGEVRRRLYTDRDNEYLRPNSWLALTSAVPFFASDVALADRLLVCRLNQRTGETDEAALTKDVAEHRDAGLSYIARALARALADNQPVQKGLNLRHPDFAEFAVKIGRAIGKEAEAITALKAVELDKSRFCLENDAVGAALLQMVQGDGKEFVGTAAELLPLLSAYDSDFSDGTKGRGGQPLWSSKRLGKRLANLFPHLAIIFDSKMERDRDKFSVFTFKPRAGCGVCGVSDPCFGKTPTEASHEDFTENSLGNSANSATAVGSDLLAPPPLVDNEGDDPIAPGLFDVAPSKNDTHPAVVGAGANGSEATPEMVEDCMCWLDQAKGEHKPQCLNYRRKKQPEEKL